MAESAIEWLWPQGYTGMAWNPITGCTKTSPGCANCYAETMSIRFKNVHGYGGNYIPNSEGRADILFHEDRLQAPFGWKNPRCVFVNSVSDLFHEDVPFEWVDKIMSVIALNPKHLFLALTKRPARMLEYFQHGETMLQDRCDDVASMAAQKFGIVWDSRGSDPNNYERRTTAQVSNRRVFPGWPLPNLWLGTSVENQHFADERLPILRQVPAVVRWASVEPLLGPIDFTKHFERSDKLRRNVTGMAGLWDESDTTSIDWAVFGGESGAGARPMHPAWLYHGISAADQAGIPVFFKQWGNYRPIIQGDTKPVQFVKFKRGVSDPGDPQARPMVKVGKKIAGAELIPDGYAPATRKQYPAGLVSKVVETGLYDSGGHISVGNEI